MNLKTCTLSILSLFFFTASMAKEPDGKTDSRRAFKLEDRNGSSKSSYGNNILSFSPLQVMDEGVGIAVSYERVLDLQKNLVSFYMPVAIAFNDFDNNGNGSNNDFTYYIMPGIKIYPTGGKGVVRYAVGPNLTYANGRKTQWMYNGVNEVLVTSNFYKLGMMVTNSLNVNPTPHLHMGLELGLGFTYIQEYENNSFNITDGPFNLVQFGFKVGYRF